MTKIEQQIVDDLRKFVESLERGTVLKDFKVTKVIKNDDGTVKRVCNKPQGTNNGPV